MSREIIGAELNGSIKAIGSSKEHHASHDLGNKLGCPAVLHDESARIKEELIEPD